MEVISCLSEMQKSSLQWEREGKKIGFVPTMGSLHLGHLSLVDLVRDQSDLVIVSIFVNPTQFAEGEDLEKYPRDLERDLLLCKEQKVDYVFTPRTEDIYKVNASTYIAERKVLAKNSAGNPAPYISRELLQFVLSFLIFVGQLLLHLGKRMHNKFRF